MDLNKLSPANKKLLQLIYIKCGENEDMTNMLIEAGLLTSAISLEASKEELHETGSSPASLLSIGVNPFKDECFDQN